MASSQDFHTAALTSLTNQIAAQNKTKITFDPNQYASTLLQSTPKIDSAVKSYLSLVAARSSTSSHVDLLATHSHKDATVGDKCDDTIPYHSCIFLENGNAASLACARVLLGGMNSTLLPDEHFFEIIRHIDDSVGIDIHENTTENHGSTKEERLQLQYRTIRLVWNGFVKNNNSTNSMEGEKKKVIYKPTKLLGKEALYVAYPFVLERFKRGIHMARGEHASGDGDDVEPTADTERKKSILELEFQSIPHDVLPPIVPPKNVDLSQWEAYYTEFGTLLNRACCGSNNSNNVLVDDDSKLLWSVDGGMQELKDRRERRTKRAESALAEDKSIDNES